MKKTSCLLLCFVLLLSVCACSEKQPSAPTPEAVQTQPLPEKTPILPDETPKPSILDGRQAADESGALWYIPNAVAESSLQQKLMPYEENLVIYGSRTDEAGKGVFALTLISRETGEMLGEKMLYDIEIPEVQLCGGLISVSDWSDGEIFLVDIKSGDVEEYRVEAEYCGVYLDEKGENAFVFTKNGIIKTALKSGATELLTENAANLIANSRSNDAVSFSYTDINTQKSYRRVLLLGSGEILDIPFDGAFYNVEKNGDTWLCSVMDEENTYYVGKTGRPSALVMKERGIMSLVSGPAGLLHSKYSAEGAELSLYGTDGSFISKVMIPIAGAGANCEPVWFEEDGGYYFTVTDESGKDCIYFWDLSVPMTGESLSLDAAYREEDVPTGAVSSKLYDKAAEIEKSYGVSIKIAEQTDAKFSEFTAAQEADESYIRAALETLEKVLGTYPEGFFPQLLYGEQREIEFQLTGDLVKTTITQGEVSGFTSFSGFVEALGAKTVVVVDIVRPGLLEQTMHHEIAHIIDNKLVFDAKLREESSYSEEGWGALNPADFDYAESYDELPESLYTDGYEQWFIDLYSRTFPREDRARILEHAMMGYDWNFAASPGRLQKLQYLADCIRDCFDTKGWAETEKWEQTLENCK